MSKESASQTTASNKTKQPTSLLRNIHATRQKAQKRAPGRPTTKQSEKLRESILMVALHAFMKHGYQGASIEAIANDSKVAKITIYRQFGDKEGLFCEMVHYANNRILTHLRTDIDTDGAPEDVLKTMIARIQESMTHPDYLEFMRLLISEAPRFPNIAHQMRDDVDIALEPLIAYLRKLKDEGRIFVDSPRDAAIQVAALAVGGIRYLLSTPSSEAQARQHRVEAIYQLFARSWGLIPIQLK